VDVQLRVAVPKTMLLSRHDAQRSSGSVAELRDWLEEETRDQDCADRHPRSSAGKSEAGIGSRFAPYHLSRRE
jgi:hypothetical protein